MKPSWIFFKNHSDILTALLVDSLSQGGTAGLVPLVLTARLVVLVGEEAPQRDTDVGELQLGAIIGNFRV